MGLHKTECASRKISLPQVTSRWQKLLLLADMELLESLTAKKLPKERIALLQLVVRDLLNQLTMSRK